MPALKWDTGNAFGAAMRISTTNTTDDTATNNAGGGDNFICADVGAATGKWYFEVEFPSNGSNNTDIGVATAGFFNMLRGQAIGNINGFSSSHTEGSGSWPGFSAPTPRIGVAFDLDAGEFFICSNVAAGSPNWNGSTSNDPATGTGGIPLGSDMSGGDVVFPACEFNAGASDSCVLFSQESDFTIAAIPSGFHALGGFGSGVHWSTTDKGPHITTSLGNLKATSSGGADGIRSDTSWSTGAYYVEFDADNMGNNFTGIGLANAAAILTALASTNDYAIGFNIGDIYVDGSSVGTWPGPNGAQIGGLVFDCDAEEFWLCPNVAASPQNWNGSTSTVPLVNGGKSFSALGTPIFVCAIIQGNTEAFTVNFGATAFAATPPAGSVGPDAGGGGGGGSPKFNGSVTIVN